MREYIIAENWQLVGTQSRVIRWRRCTTEKRVSEYNKVC